jgi:phosphoglycerol transferase MdoB-like AlkP superfamily enzyme
VALFLRISDVMFTPRSRQVSTVAYTVGATFFVYGAGLALVTGLFGLVALQGADEESAVLPHLALLLGALAVPAALVLIGRGLMRGKSAAYYAALLLPVVIVPLATWSLLKTEGRAVTPFAQAAELLGIEAVFASASILLSIALFVARWRGKGYEA